MADVNSAYLATQVEQYKYNPPGNGRQYPQFWVRTKLPGFNVQWDDQQVAVPATTLFCNIRVSQKQMENQKILNAVLNGLGHQNGAYFIATDGTLKSYFSKKHQTEVWSLEFSISNFRVRNTPLHPENLVILCGKVLSAQGGWLLVEESYRNPFKNEWNTRKIWVYTGQELGLQERQPVYVRGRLASKRPDGVEMLYVVADFVT